MKLNRYEFKSGDKFLTYEFLSEGPKGKIQKLIQFSLVNQDTSFFNLAFGDKILKQAKLMIWLSPTMVTAKKFLPQSYLLFMLSATNFPKPGFIQQVVQKQEHVFIKWALTNILTLYKKTLKFSDLLKMNGNLL